MKRAFSQLIKTWILSALMSLGCVSVEIGGPDQSRSEVVDLKEPETPFEARSADYVDRLWVNRLNGNAISYLSQCRESYEAPLQEIALEAVSQLAKTDCKEPQEMRFNRRTAIDLTCSGEVDGVLSSVRVVTFRKNHCLYILNFSGVARAFTQDQSRFQTFLDRFRVP